MAWQVPLLHATSPAPPSPARSNPSAPRSAMMAEAVHSLVDTANQVLLRVGLNKAQRAPTAIHPYGYTRDRFIWPLISAVGIFCCGAGVSFVHGVQGLFEHREVTNLMYNFIGECLGSWQCPPAALLHDLALAGAPLWRVQAGSGILHAAREHGPTPIQYKSAE